MCIRDRACSSTHFFRTDIKKSFILVGWHSLLVCEATSETHYMELSLGHQRFGVVVNKTSDTEMKHNTEMK